MRMVIQRVTNASVSVDEEIVGQIAKGIAVLLGVAKGDTEKDADYLVNKLIGLRIFEDEAGKMNLSLQEVGGEVLVVSQFTLLGDCRKGRRPGFSKAAPPQEAERLYLYVVEQLRARGIHVETGQFQAMMLVKIYNDGPVTFVIDSI
ncbi:D-tyrosyl-tRNA(Tyr) deacylase [candidate division KSB3 bacterium]|uniref:D-aminoacyl-tRNA deacylase n=1 Tax=candidate division KSB3 bacterium TaxID=2044937 RepID=A0A2G6E8J3_9BACT|nr:MAG: D-tyrosyl-tRNA(Tyr) deacylase [candidate division KSB3 bacterium]PIE30440.1 MAG: D-tyrosyl-tRNA(Tyr) deacylase [candidate division KSB3 bacterium]